VPRRTAEIVTITLAWATLVVAALTCRPLTPVDETRYLSVAWEMWQRGDLLVPFLNGQPYSHKPPLLFWMMQAGWGLFGVNEWWPRLVGPLFALANLLLTLRLARRLWPDEEDRWSGLVLPILAGSLAWAAYGTATLFDMPLTFFALLGISAIWELLRQDRLRAWLTIALSIGGGILAKGPVILLLVLPAAALAPWWAGERPARGWASWYLRMGLALLLGVGIALAWAVPAALSGGPQYADAIFWGQTAGRMVESFAHRRPVWWYIPLLPIVLFPWLLWGGTWRGLKRLPLDRGTRFCLSWMAPTFLTFSLISGKQVHYLLPVMPGFAILAARGLGRLERRPTRADRAVLAVFLLALAVLFPLAPLLQGPIPDLRWVAAASPLWGALLALIGLGLLVHRPRTYRTQVWPMGLLVLAFVTALHLGPIRSQRAAFDLAPMARRIAGLQSTGHPVAHYGRYQDEYQFLGRLHRPIQPIDDAPALRAWISAHPDGYVVARFGAKLRSAASDADYVQPYQEGWVGLWSARRLAERPSLPGENGGAAKVSPRGAP